MPTLSSRRWPWPWDARIALNKPAAPGGLVGDFRGKTIGSLRGTLIGNLRPRGKQLGLGKGFMLLPQPDSSLLIGRKQTNLENLYPATAEYDSAPVYRERTFMFRPTGGLGEPIQSSAGDRRYHYGVNVWVTGGLFGKGPLCHGIMPAATQGVRRFVEAINASGQLALFILIGSGVYERSDDTNAGQILRRTIPGWAATDAARFTGAYAGAVDALYVAWGGGQLEEFSGGVWTPCVLPAGFNAMLLEVVGDELWAADWQHSILRKCTADPKLAGSWSGPILVGTPWDRITAIRQVSNRLVIFKESGRVFTINGDGTDNDLFPGLISTPDPDNGRTAWAWLDSLWFRVGRAFYKLDMMGGPVLTPAGPGRNLSNSSEVTGPVQAWCGWNAAMAFAGIYNESLGNSYLLSYGSWIPRASEGNEAGGSYAFADQYDGALVRWVGRKITALWTSSVPSEARLYIGFADSGYDWIKLVPYPLAPDAPARGAEYTTGECWLLMPLHHAMFQADTKQWTGVTIFGPTMELGDKVWVQYRLKGAATPPSALPTGDFLDFGDQPMTESGGRRDPDTQIAGQAIEIKMHFQSPGSSTTPILEGLGLHERLVPRFRRDYTMTINANDFVTRRDGASTRQSGVQIRAMLEEAAAAPASLTLVLPDERVNDVAIFTHEEHQMLHTQRGGLGWGINVQATQFTTRDLYGTIARLRGTLIGDLRGFTIDRLRVM
jgi:hypothetical protein